MSVWLGRLWVAALAAFVLLTVLVLGGALKGADATAAHGVETVAWGGLVPLMRATNAIGELGPIQVAIGSAALVGLLLWNWRTAAFVAFAGLASVLNVVIRLFIDRNAPHGGAAAGFDGTRTHSYPSGHAVLFTWVSVVTATLVSPWLGRAGRALAWGGAVLLVALACLGRVWVGAHWPSDVLAGVLLGVGWSAFALWVGARAAWRD